MLFDYFISKIFVGAASMTIVSWFFDGGPDIDFADLAKAKETEEVLNIKFDTSPSGVSALRAENNFLGLRRKNKFILRSTFVVVEMARISPIGDIPMKSPCTSTCFLHDV